ncbi:MAG: hypothetical protein AAB089_04455 [Nitrospirota bacterium]
MFDRRSKGQSTLEYVILIGLVVSALVTIGVYMKRGIQGRLRTSTDEIGEQYSAKHTTGKYKVVTKMEQLENMAAGSRGRTTTNILTNIQTKTGEGAGGVYETVNALDEE